MYPLYTVASDGIDTFLSLSRSGYPEYRVQKQGNLLTAAVEHPDGLAGDRTQPYGYSQDGTETDL